MSATSFIPAGPQIGLGHTLDATAPRPFIIIDADRPVLEVEDGAADLAGCGCANRPYLYRDAFGRVERVLIEHEAGCRWYAQLDKCRLPLTFPETTNPEGGHHALA
ncbi:hypothetical protein [Streptomyces sp. RPT161]|uniref:hypothetical protein n=1 Tax=Streptomyces sp. RPT161 TaxID=3015993 RepID=UPI0022B8E6B9|nr:hypothetical protein [Streptomyces sp. RPT161]